MTYLWTQFLCCLIVDELTEAFNLPEDEFETKYDAPKPSKEADNLVLYCRSGVRAANGCEELSKLGYQKYVRLSLVHN